MPELSLFDSNAITRIGVYDQIKSLEISRKLRRPSTFRLEVATQTPRYEELTRGRYIGLSDISTQTINRVMRIDQLERSTEADSVILTGRDYAGWFDFRLCVPPAGQSHHAFTNVRAETILKTLVSANAGPTASANRVLPNLVIEADQARGQLVSIQARYQALSEMLEELLTFDGGGYQIVYVPGPTNMHRLEYISPVDRSQSVFLDLEFESVSSQQWIESDIDMRDSLYVAGQGEGVNRLIVNRYLGGAARAGLARREAFVDARDLSLQAALEARGDSLLAQMAVDNRFAATLYERGSFRYGTDFNLGDIVTVQNRKWAMDVAARVVSATLRWTDTEQPEISLEVARAWPTIKERMSQEAYGISQVTPKGAVDYHSENHALRHATGGADVVTPAAIGAAPSVHTHAEAVEPLLQLQVDTVDQSIPSATWTGITWRTVIRNVGFTYTPPNHLITIPSNGIWEISVTIPVEIHTGFWMIGFPGAQTPILRRIQGAADTHMLHVSTPARIYGNTQFQIQIWHDKATPLLVYSSWVARLSMARVGGAS